LSPVKRQTNVPISHFFGLISWVLCNKRAI
jgi:hypothetical protein